MSFVISIYSNKNFKEILLPAIHNADYIVVLEKGMFALEKDVLLKLEVVDSFWKIVASSQYYVYKNRENYAGKKIKNADILELVLGHRKRLTLLIKELKNDLPVYEKYFLTDIRHITIGKDMSKDICYNNMGLVSSNHATIEVNGSWCTIYDESANGVFINEARCEERKQLEFGDCINIFGLHMVYLGNILAIDSTVDNLQINERILKPIPEESFLAETEYLEHSSPDIVEKEKVFFHRAPRTKEKIETETIEIEGPPSPVRLQKRSWFLTIGPSFTMAIPMLMGSMLSMYAARANGGGSILMYTGIITAISSAIIGSGWAILNLKRQKKMQIEEETKRRAAYDKYLEENIIRIEQIQNKNANALNKMYPSAVLAGLYDENTMQLWNRNWSHEDFLYQRLGVGNIPFQAEIQVPKKKFRVYKDVIEDKPIFIKEKFHDLKGVSVGVDLYKQRLVGVIGGKERKGAYQIARILITQIAANNCYTDVKIALTYDQNRKIEEEIFGCVKWLPHVWSEDKRTRFISDDSASASEIFYELTKVLRKRAENESNSQKNIYPKPYYILIVTNPKFLEDELIAKYVMKPKTEYGLTTLLLAEQYEELPNSCEYIIQNDRWFQGAYSVGEELSVKNQIQFDSIDKGGFDNFARRLANISVNEVETGGEIPSGLTFLDMYQVDKLEELQVLNRWTKNRTYDSMRAVIGYKAGRVPCYLDVHEKYHGPHGLVAGTTGSGKSETLQTYIASLAVNFSPNDIGFFIIDYKGGGMASLFANLPHTMGHISNLSGNQVKRAMVSIKSENRRRQRMFNEAGVNNINQYTRLYKEKEVSVPIPHLFIIIDEFAELKREEPDFMRELISVAQVGRSLGVHLILATQKPSGTVDDNIWSNSKFRLCLRVQDKQDSNDMLHKPDAAYLTQAGRCYLQVGNDELYELFQSGFSGATYDKDGNQKIDFAKMYTINGKEALVGNRSKIKKKEKAKREWLCLLLEITNQAARNYKIRSVDSMNEEISEQIQEYIFQKLIAQKIDYTKTEYNQRRMEEFFLLYLEIMAGGIFDVEKQIEFILNREANRGVKLPEIKEKTQLDALVEYLKELAKANHYTYDFMLWLPVLAKELYLTELAGYRESSFDGRGWKAFDNEKWKLQAFLGFCDDPVNQAQMPLEIDFAEKGHYAICGTVVSGKSTLLQTLAFSIMNRYAPDYVNLYMIDFSNHMLSAFEEFPHVGGVMYENDFEKISKFFFMMGEILNERKKLLKGGSYAQYVQVNGNKFPAIIIMIDKYAAFKEKTNNMYEERLIQLTRDGGNYGIYLVITAAGFGIADIQNRIAENIRSVVCLEMGDKFQYMDVMHTMNISVFPEAGVKGRGIAKVGKEILEFQTALAFPAKDDYERSKLIAEVGQKMNRIWNGRRAKQIPEIPEKPVLNEFLQLEDVREKMLEPRYLPIGYNAENAAIYSIDLSKIYTYLISGQSRTGKTNLLKILITMTAQKPGNLCVIDLQGTLKNLAECFEARYITNYLELFEFFRDLLPVFKERNMKKKTALLEGVEEEELYEVMSDEKPYYIFIDDLEGFIELATHPTEGVGAIKGFLENITEKGSFHQVFFFCCFTPENAKKLTGIRLYENIVKYKTGIYFGGRVNEQRILNFDYLSYTEQSKSLKNGIGLLSGGEQVEKAQKVVIPLVKITK